MVDNFTVVEGFFIFAACISFCVGTSVAATILIFPNIRRQYFMQLIGFTQFSWVCSSLANAFGFPANGSNLCSAQSFLQLYFTQAACVWFLLFVGQYHSFVVYKKLQLNMAAMHLIAWAFPLIVATSPLLHMPYGRPTVPPYQTGLGTCTFATNSITELRQYFLDLYAAEYAFLITLMVLFVGRLWLTHQSELGSSLVTVGMMTLGVLVFWLPFAVIAGIVLWGPSEQGSWLSTAFVLTWALGLQCGTFLSIAFHVSSPESYEAWKEVYQSLVGVALTSPLLGGDGENTKRKLSFGTDIQC